MQVPFQSPSLELWDSKYRLKDAKSRPVDMTMDDTFKRVARALASSEKNKEYWEEQFFKAMKNGAIPAGRIMANAGAGEHKPSTSAINCTVSQVVEDSIEGILEAVKKAGQTLSAGCGIGYEFSTLRPRGSFVQGAGASTSGTLSFMAIFDAMCFTVASAGGRRGAQMGTLAVWHPDVEAFIDAKRANGAYRQFNLSLLIDDMFMEAVKHDTNYQLIFPVKKRDLADVESGFIEVTERKRFWEKWYCEKEDFVVNSDDMILCKVHRTIKAKDLWDKIMKSTYDYAEPGFLLIDEINRMNTLHFMEEIRATNPCGISN
jgi:ribonucleoside-diphosphate reductase alpha chain